VSLKIIVGPYLQNVSRNSMTIMWHTDAPAFSVVEYERSHRLGWSAYTGRISPTFDSRIEDSRLKTIHAVTLDDLEGGTEYFYRVSSGETGSSSVTSEPATFRTAAQDDSPVSFISFGDSQGLASALFRNAELARKYHPMLCVGTGDLAMNTTEHLRSHFFENTGELLRYTPWFATMGNHDAPSEGYFQYFSYPEPRYWYSFNHGCAHFTVANSNMDYRPGSEQWAWLEYDLDRFRHTRWKFVFFHHPPYASNNSEIPETRVLCPLLERYGVDIVFNAHPTIYERSCPLTNGRYDSENGVIYIVAGGGGYDMSVVTSELWDHLHPTSAMAKAENHFVLTRATPDECCVRAIDNEDKILDSFSLSRTPGKKARMADASVQLPYPDNYELEEGSVVAGFEEDSIRWVLPRPHYSLDTECTRSGGTSIRWSHDGEDPVYPALRRVLGHDGGVSREVGEKRFLVSTWVKTQAVKGGVTVSFEWSGDNGFLDRVESEAIEGTQDWTRLTFEVQPESLYPYHNELYACRVLLSARPGSTGTAWFDDVSVQEAIEPQPTPGGSYRAEM